MRPRALLVLGGMAALLATAGCLYAPNPASGTLRCGANRSCPEGYECTDGLTCWKKGQPTPAQFYGHWVFSASGTRTIACNDGSSDTTSLLDDFVDIAAGGTSDLSADYFCVWDLDIGGAGTTATILPDQGCMGTDSSSGTTFTFYGDSFNFSTTTGLVGTVTASLPYDFVDSLGAGTCSMTINGAVTKTP